MNVTQEVVSRCLALIPLIREHQGMTLEELSRLSRIPPDQIADEHKPDGFNIGLNDGLAAGQTVPHVHIHVIPRYDGDVQDPRGGVRGVIPEKAPYRE